MLQSKDAGSCVSTSQDLLEFEAKDSGDEINRRLNNCKALICQEARRIYDSWIIARRSNDTDLTLQEWMQGKQIAVIGRNQMLQIERAGLPIEVMPSDLAELVSYSGFGYVFSVTSDNGIVKISAVTDMLIRH